MFLLTKSDKFKRGKASSILLGVKKELIDAPMTTVQLFSALKKEGVDQARSSLAQLCFADRPESIAWRQGVFKTSGLIGINRVLGSDMTIP